MLQVGQQQSNTLNGISHEAGGSIALIAYPASKRSGDVIVVHDQGRAKASMAWRLAATLA